MEFAVLHGSIVGSGRGSAAPPIRVILPTDTLISGSPEGSIWDSAAPDATSPLVAPPQDFGAFRGIALSLAFEAAAVAMGFGLWEVWKLVR